MACCILRFIGRALFVAIFILSGIDKLQNPAKSAGFLVSRLEMMEKLVHTKHNVTLPAPYKVSEFVQHSEKFIQGVGIYVIVAAVGTLFAYKCANCLIGTFIFLTIVLIHNPLYEFKDQPELHKSELLQFILNVALWGVSMTMTGCCGSDKSCKKDKKKVKKNAETTETPKTSAKADSDGKGKKKKSKRD